FEAGEATFEARGVNGDRALFDLGDDGVDAAGKACGDAEARPCFLRESLRRVAALVAQQLRGVGLNGIPYVECRIQSAAHAGCQRHRTKEQQHALRKLKRQRADRVAELSGEVAELTGID